MRTILSELKQVCIGLLFLLTAATAACGPSREEPAPVLVGDVFTVGMGETAVIASENLTITFESVLDDSRCPTNVECFWTGEARGVLSIQQGDGEPVDWEFNTNPAPPLNIQSLEWGDYLLELQSLDPYPQDPEPAITQSEYRVTLVVTKP
ncbi:MAG: hypothetical protein H6658_00795 [Ardenticatenaceae bacterium]|nr:hypothetical protein [Ardenticatenaceae bacterium]